MDMGNRAGLSRRLRMLADRRFHADVETGLKGAVWARACRCAGPLKFFGVTTITATMASDCSMSKASPGRSRRPAPGAWALLFGLLMGAPAATADAPGVPAITPTEAKVHVGELVRVCGIVASAHYAPQSRRAPTFLNLERPYPRHVFTIVIWQENRAAFGEPEVAYLGKRVCVTGTVKTYRGRPEIVATEPRQLSAD